MNISCNVMDDLLALYAEDMVCADTADLVQAHLAECAVCREKMKAFPEKELQMHQSLDNLSKLQKKIRSRRLTSSWFAFLLTATLLLSVLAYLVSPVYLTVEEANVEVFQGDSVSFVYREGEDGNLTYSGQTLEYGQDMLILRFGGKVRHVAESRTVDPDTGLVSLTISASCSRFDMLFPKHDKTDFSYTREEDFDRLYYASYDGREDTLLWGRELNGGVQTLPRLVLGYYTVIAVLAGGVLLTGWAVLRKKKESAYLLMAGSWFLSFSISAILVSGGKWPTGDAAYVPWMMGFAVVLASLMTATALVGRRLWNHHKEDV